MNEFKLTEEAIFLNGQKTKIISGAIHYFRISVDDWKDRLLKLKECGCNCVETYTIWSMHEKKEKHGMSYNFVWPDVYTGLKLSV